MTQRQEKAINEAEKCLQSARKWMDFVMYYSDVLTEKEHRKICSAYDNVCAAIDKL